MGLFAGFAYAETIAILMGCQMSVMDGFEATITLRENEESGR